MRLVELVRAEALQRRLVPARADGQGRCREEERLVQARRVGGVQDRRQLRRRRRQDRSGFSR